MIDQETLQHSVVCERFSPFKLRLALDWQAVELPLRLVEDAWQRFASSPIAAIASSLEKEVIASGIYGTHTIEGGELSEEETANTLAQPPRSPDDNRRAVLNLKTAYEHAQTHSSAADWRLTPAYIQDIHRQITTDIPHSYSHPPKVSDKARRRRQYAFVRRGDATQYEAFGGWLYNTPGQYRNNSKDIVTQVGNPPYKPPQYHGDISRCIAALCEWQETLQAAGVPALIRAPLVHYYYEIIHPFWDGNGRVGRVLEASILLHEGMNYAPFAQARYYLRHIDRYFSLFNHTRLAHKRKEADANTAFVVFFLQGMRDTIHQLHDRINEMTKVLLYSYRLNEAKQDKRLNARQYSIVRLVLEQSGQYTRKTLTESPHYQVLYKKVSERSERRDWLGLVDWLDIDADKRLYPRL